TLERTSDVSGVCCPAAAATCCMVAVCPAPPGLADCIMTLETACCGMTTCVTPPCPCCCCSLSPAGDTVHTQQQMRAPKCREHWDLLQILSLDSHLICAPLPYLLRFVGWPASLAWL